MSDGETGESALLASPAPAPPPLPPAPPSPPSAPESQGQGFTNAAYDDSSYDDAGDRASYVNTQRNESAILDDDSDDEPEEAAYVNVADVDRSPDSHKLIVDEETQSHDTSFDDTSTQMTSISAGRSVRFKDEDETIGVSEPYDDDSDDEGYVDPYTLDHVSSFTRKKKKKKTKEKKAKKNKSPVLSKLGHALICYTPEDMPPIDNHVTQAPPPTADNGYSQMSTLDAAVLRGDVLEDLSTKVDIADEKFSQEITVTLDPETVHDDLATICKDERARLRETLFFLRTDEKRRIDYVLAYEETTDANKTEKRTIFENNLEAAGLLLEAEPSSNSVDQKTAYTKLHAPMRMLLTGAELLSMNKRLKMPKEMGDDTGCSCCSCNPCQAGEDIIPEEDDFFTAPFNRKRMAMFDIDPNDPEAFFTNAERSLILKEILDRTQFSPEGSTETRFGIFKLLNEGVYHSCFPLHEGPYKKDVEDPTPFQGSDKDRSRLYEAWARPGRWYCYQPLDLVRKYFGEKIAVYFAWLGFYTMMLIPPSILGLAAFVYGIATLFDDAPSREICNANTTGGLTMCPQCDKDCLFWDLYTSCFYSQISYVFDNYATVIFATFMSIWSTCFLEFWKRQQKSLQYDWDVADFELEERMRPEFEFKVKKTKENPITKIKEPYMPLYQKIPRSLTSLTIILFMLLLVIAAIVGVMIYRMVIVSVFYLVDDPKWVGSNASLFTSVTAACINFVIIMILNLLYKQIALFLTNLENHRTYTEYEDSFTVKMFLFQFINYYGSIFYIAFFKGRFLTYPGSDDYVLFDNFKQDSCHPAGCMVELSIQLFIVMVGKQIMNNAKELLLPGLKNWFRGKSQMKNETDSNLYMRWEQDNNLEKMQLLSLFDEYLEMVIQFGFVTIFVAAFPLAPLFALINNIIEIRLDAFKFVTQFQRAPATKTQDIGAWGNLLKTISFVAVLSNGAIIAFTSEFVPRMVYMLTVNPDENLEGFIDNSLAVFRVSDYPDEKMPPSAANTTIPETCRFRGYYTGPDSPKPYEYTEQYWIVFCARLGFLLIFEHVCFLLTWIVAFAIPDVPGSVKRLMLYEKQLVRKTTFDAAFAEDRDEHTQNQQY